MIYLKSFVAGLLVFVCGAILGFIALVVYIRVHFKTMSMSFDISPRSPDVWVYLLILFLAGFVFEFHRLHSQIR
jgi:hypothetical protein